MAQPFLVLKIPLDGFGNSCFEIVFRLPTKFLLDFIRADSIASIVTKPVFDMIYKRIILAKSFENRFDNLEIASLVMSADIVDFSVFSLSDNQIDGFAVIGNMKPITNVLAITIDRKLFVIPGFLNHERNQFLRELIGAIIVGATGDSNGKAVSSVICQNKKIGSGFGRRIRRRGMKRRIFMEKKIRSIQRKVSVDFIGGNLMIPFDSVFSTSIHQNGNTDDIGLKEDLRILDGTIDMAFRGKIDYDIKLFILKQTINGIPISDIPFDELEVFQTHDWSKGFHVPGISQGIQANEFIFGIFSRHDVEIISTDESSTSSD